MTTTRLGSLKLDVRQRESPKLFERGFVSASSDLSRCSGPALGLVGGDVIVTAAADALLLLLLLLGGDFNDKVAKLKLITWQFCWR